MAKDLLVTLDGKVIYHIKLTDSFQGLAEELKQLGYQADQKNLYYFRFECCKNFMQRL